MNHHKIADNKSQLFGSTEDCDQLAMGKHTDCDQLGHEEQDLAAKAALAFPALTVDKEWDGKLDKLAKGEAEGLWFKSGKLWFKVRESVKTEL